MTSAARRLGLGFFSDDFARLLRYGRGVDVGRLEQQALHSNLVRRGHAFV